MTTLESCIKDFISKTLNKYHMQTSLSIFDEFMKFCQDYYEKPAHSVAEIKLQKNTKLKGDIFELFVQKYLIHCYKGGDFFRGVWLLRDVPDDVLSKLSLKRHDVGIDIIAVDNNNKFYAVQVKYRKKGYKVTHGIGWQTLSTFYGLVNRSGPWERYVVVTNADYIRHMGKKDKRDLSICYGTLKSITLEGWEKMCGFSGQILDCTQHKISNIDNLREKRIAYFEKSNINI